MATFVLTGGIGSGKSLVLTKLVTLGARSIDADEIVASLQVPGEAVFDTIVDRFGADVLEANGNLDRSALSKRVFADKAELKALEDIVHPAVRSRITETLKMIEYEDPIPPAIVIDIPLVVSRDALYGAVGVVVVDCSYTEAIRRLTTYRSMTFEDAEARISNQISREGRLALADFVLDNDAGLDQLDDEVNRCWTWMLSQCSE